MVLPHALETEQYLLGCLLINPDSLPGLAALTADDFYDSRHQIIFRAIHYQFQKKQPVDIVIIGQLLKERAQLDLAGGRAYLADLSIAVISTRHAPYYARIITGKSILRRLIRAGQEITAIGYSDTDANESIKRAHMVLHRAIPALTFFKPFSQHQCLQLISKHGDKVWDKFWEHMSEQISSGANLQYVRDCHDALVDAVTSTINKDLPGPRITTQPTRSIPPLRSRYLS